MTQNDQTTLAFSPIKFIESLMNEMGFEKSDSATQDEMATELNKQVNSIILNTASLYADEDVLDETLANDENENLADVTRQLINMSPDLQAKIIEELDKFYNETVESFKRLSNK